MDIRTGLDGLRSLLGVSETQASASQGAKSRGAHQGGPTTSDSATLSSAASEMAQTDPAGEVRMDKVASVQAALASGAYQVPASAVASRMVDAMLAAGH